MKAPVEPQPHPNSLERAPSTHRPAGPGSGAPGAKNHTKGQGPGTCRGCLGGRSHPPQLTQHVQHLKDPPRALQATGSPTDLESTWAQQEALLPSVAADQLLTETCVGPYEVLRRLGDGEFSTVVECRKADNPETFALKVIGKAKVQRHSRS